MSDEADYFDKNWERMVTAVYVDLGATEDEAREAFLRYNSPDSPAAVERRSMAINRMLAGSEE